MTAITYGGRPLKCGRCELPKWNDDSVCWLPLVGDARRPYCARSCAVFVMLRADMRGPGRHRLEDATYYPPEQPQSEATRLAIELVRP